MYRVILLAAAWLLSMPGPLMAQYTSVTKTVSDPVLSPGAFVEFTIEIENREGPQTGVFVEDILPDGLVIPDGTAPSTSRGDYDPATGLWILGDMATDEVQSLRIPAQVVADPLPDCIVNHARAFVEHPIGPLSQGRDLAVLKQPGSGICVDLELLLTQRSSDCKGTDSAIVDVKLTNLGANEVQRVLVVLEDGPDVPPGIEMIRCTSPLEGNRCYISVLYGGSIAEFALLSLEAAGNEVPVDYEVTVSVTGTRTDGESDSESVTVAWTKQPPAECPKRGQSGSDSDICLIATAAYGSSMHPYVKRLRAFRDSVLLPTHAGRTFVEFYYRYSPPVADYIAERPALRAIVRAVLWPLVFAIVHPLTLLGGMLGLLVAFVGWRRKRHHAA